MLKDMYESYAARLERIVARRSSSRFAMPYLMCQEGLRAFERSNVVVWLNYNFPVEIITAFGFVPFLYEIAAGFVSTNGEASSLLEAAERRQYSRDSCSYHRIAIGGALEGHFPSPTIAVGVSHPCDGQAKVAEVVSHAFHCPYLLLDVPYSYSPAAVDYVERQLARIVDRLTEITGRPLDEERLRQTIRNANRLRAILIRINDLRKNIPAPLYGRLAWEFRFLAHSIWATDRCVSIYEQHQAELEQTQARGSTTGEKLRLLWLLAIMNFSHEFFDMLENEFGAHTVMEEVNAVYWPEFDVQRPLRGLAEKIMANPFAGPVTRRLDQALTLARDYRVHGAIHLSHWGCRQGCGGVHLLSDGLAKIGVPLLDLDGDCADDRNYSPGQVKTRVQGFVEMLQ